MTISQSSTEFFPKTPGVSPDRQMAPWHEVAIVIAITVISIAVSIRFQLNERLYALTRHWEYFQLDEFFPVGLLVLSLCLIWLAWRRFQHAQRELMARARTEAQLVDVLAHNRSLAKEHLRIQEEERRHLARELHDELGQYLNSVKLDATAIEEQAAADPVAVSAAAVAIVRSVDHLYEVVSGMIARLRPVGLEELGLAAAIEHCIDVWQRRMPQTRFRLFMTGALDELEDHLAVTVYRVVQESLTNVSKHANAQEVVVELTRSGLGLNAFGEVHVSIRDNGCGLGTGAATPRFGISGMRERVELAGGRFSLHSTPGSGVQIAAVLPILATT